MLAGDLYEVLERRAGESLIRLRPESDVYAGHFPGFPITPGVALVQIALELVRKEAGKPFEIKASRNIKFLIPATPGSELRYQYVSAGDGIWDITVKMGEEICARMNLVLE